MDASCLAKIIKNCPIEIAKEPQRPQDRTLSLLMGQTHPYFH